jgi:hypothetical protein
MCCVSFILSECDNACFSFSFVKFRFLSMAHFGFNKNESELFPVSLRKSHSYKDIYVCLSILLIEKQYYYASERDFQHNREHYLVFLGLRSQTCRRR